uniref:Uncharacterized protein n=1 Tax=Antarctic circular DNA molecule TaxID=2664238 RepID=A0A5Q2EZB5_9ZZZZ|nr:hypothetical protein [Antarctic circular DNA molecule]
MGRRKYAAQTITRRGKTLTRRSASKNVAKATIKRLITSLAEHKYYDNFATGLAMIPTGLIQAGLTTPVQGTGDGQRVGDKVTILSLTIKFDIIGADTTNACRVIIFRWGMPTVPVPADVFQTAGVVTTYNSLPNYDRVGQKQLRVLYDRTFSTTANGTNAYSRRIRIGKNAGPLEFNNGAITGTGLIYGLFISDSQIAPHPSLSWYSRLTYTDM